MSTDRQPLFVIVLFSTDQTEVASRGVMAETTFREQFVDPYALRGERHHPGPDAVARGAVVATDEVTVFIVPIRAWSAGDGTERWLCQASDDGSPPALSVLAGTADALVSEVTRRLAGG